MAPKKVDEEAVDVQPDHGNEEKISYSPERRESNILNSVKSNATAILHNPLAGYTKQELFDDVEDFAREKNLMYAVDDIKKGALAAQNPKTFESLDELSAEDKQILRNETEHRWRQPFMMYFMTVLCAGSAIVQGMDQTCVNGAQIFYYREFNITDVWIQGLVNGAPYLCSVCIGCWTSAPCNK
jgi:hypothetical protein